MWQTKVEGSQYTEDNPIVPYDNNKVFPSLLRFYILCRTSFLLLSALSLSLSRKLMQRN